MVQPEDLFSPASRPNLSPVPQSRHYLSPVPPFHYNENVPPDCAWVAVFRVTNIAWDFLFFFSHPAINFETVLHLVFQNEKTPILPKCFFILYPAINCLSPRFTPPLRFPVIPPNLCLTRNYPEVSKKKHQWEACDLFFSPFLGFSVVLLLQTTVAGFSFGLWESFSWRKNHFGWRNPWTVMASTDVFCQQERIQHKCGCKFFRANFSRWIIACNYKVRCSNWLIIHQV